MTRKELLEKIKAVGFTEEQEELIKKCLRIKENKKFIPEKGEKYYYIDSYGDVEHVYFGDYTSDKYKLFVNNCFKTIEEANFRLEQIKVYNELKNFADENNEEINWKKPNISKYHIGIDYDYDNLEIVDNFAYRYIWVIYFSSEELAKQAIEKVGADRIKKYLFGVDLC